MKISNNKAALAAYMTVEASLLLPCIIMILVLTIYWTFYMYNKCVIYQDCYISALRGSQQINKEDSEVYQITQDNIKTLLTNQLFQYQIEPEIFISDERVKVKTITSIEILNTNIIDLKGNNLNSEREAYSIRVNPSELIRDKY